MITKTNFMIKELSYANTILNIADVVHEIEHNYNKKIDVLLIDSLDLLKNPSSFSVYRKLQITFLLESISYFSKFSNVITIASMQSMRESVLNASIADCIYPIISSIDVCCNINFSTDRKKLIVTDIKNINEGLSFSLNFDEKTLNISDPSEYIHDNTSCGYKALDELMFKYYKTDVSCLFLSPAGGGKTTFLCNLARNFANVGKNVVLISLDEQVTKLTMRLITMTNDNFSNTWA